MRTTKLLPPHTVTVIGLAGGIYGERFRVMEWVNLATLEPVFGIQVRREESRRARARWVNCAVDGEALIYANRETADRNCRWLNDPKGTEPEWNKDSAIQTHSGGPAR